MLGADLQQAMPFSECWTLAVRLQRLFWLAFEVRWHDHPAGE